MPSIFDRRWVQPIQLVDPSFAFFIGNLHVCFHSRQAEYITDKIYLTAVSNGENEAGVPPDVLDAFQYTLENGKNPCLKVGFKD